MLIALMALGLVLIILMMALIINPPEALIKKVFHRSKPKENDKDSE